MRVLEGAIAVSKQDLDLVATRATDCKVGRTVAIEVAYGYGVGEDSGRLARSFVEGVVTFSQENAHGAMRIEIDSCDILKAVIVEIRHQYGEWAEARKKLDGA